MVELAEAQINEFLATLPGWRLVERAGRQRIEKVYKTGNFAAGVDLINRLAPVAEQLNHHPDVSLTYSAVKVEITTHDAGGITEKDFALARRIELAAR